MAKVLPNYSLCPLIERKSFIGITEDSEPDRIVVTVNGNIVSRLIVSNAKLLYSWNTKGTITAPVIYANSVERYIGIFNGNILRLWESNTVNIDKVKSHKFVSELHSVLNVPGGRNRTLVIFKSGHFCDLDEAISARKTIDGGGKSSNLLLLQEHESVQKAEVISFDKSMISLTTVLAESDELKLHVIPLDDNRVPLTFNLTYSNDDDDVGKYVCHCFVMTDKYSSLITLWSTGKLFITRLFSTFSSNDPDDVASFPGRFLTRLPVNTDNRAVLLRSISAYDIAVYGGAANTNNEDDEKPEGLLLFFNLKYNVLQPLARYKNFTVPPYFFNFGSNLFLIIGHNLVAMPYTLRNQKLSALVGTVSVADDNLHIEEETITTDNNDHQRITISQSSEELKCNNSNNVLIRKLLESNDDDVANNNLLHALEACVDISDDVIVDVLKLCLTDIALYGNVLQTLLCRYTLMDSSKLRDVSSNSMLILLDELTTNQFCTTTAFRYQEKVLKWLAAILDVFYTHCLVDETPVIVETLLRMNNFLKGELKRCEDYKQLLALSSVIRRKKIIWNK